MKYLITGLGNPGDEYAHTRHNIGFDILDSLAGESNVSFIDSRYGYTADFKFRSRIIHLLKPSTFVNLSGKAVSFYLKKHKIPLENLLIIADDLALPFGKLRLRSKGGAAGHNGLSDIIQVLGTQDFARLRFGIGSDYPQGYQVDYVLGHFTQEEKSQLPEKTGLAREIITSFCTIGISHTMNLYNKR